MTAVPRSAKAASFRAALVIVIVLFLSGFAADASAQANGRKAAQPSKSRNAGKDTAKTVSPKVAQVNNEELLALLKPSGKPLLVNFWATWCVPCREEFPDLVEIDAHYAEKIDFITVSLDFIEEIDRDVPKFLAEMKAKMPAYLLVSTDESALISSIAKDWSGGLPFTILYDGNGEIAYFRQGKIKKETLAAAIDELLAGSGKP